MKCTIVRTEISLDYIRKTHRASGVHLGHGPRVYTLRAKRQISTHLKGSSPPDTLRLWIDELDTGRHGVKIEGEDAEVDRMAGLGDLDHVVSFSKEGKHLRLSPSHNRIELTLKIKQM